MEVVIGSFVQEIALEVLEMNRALGKAGWKYAVSYANFSIVFVLFKSRNLTIVTFVSITVCSKQVVTSNHGHGKACQSWQQAKATDSSMSSEGCMLLNGKALTLALMHCTSGRLFDCYVALQAFYVWIALAMGTFPGMTFKCLCVTGARLQGNNGNGRIYLEMFWKFMVLDYSRGN
ncbi:hypothetical protein CsSME_00016716 [Camellia sinensis var. sinensis]